MSLRKAAAFVLVALFFVVLILLVLWQAQPAPLPPARSSSVMPVFPHSDSTPQDSGLIPQDPSPLTPPPTLASLLPLGTLSPLHLAPEDIALNAKTPDPKLAESLAEWQAHWFEGKRLWLSQTQRLDARLKNSTLSAAELLSLAHAVHFLAGEEVTAVRFYEAASHRVEAELTRAMRGELTLEQVRPLLHAILYHLQDMKDTFWPPIEQWGMREYAESLFRIYSNFVLVANKSGDPELVKAARHPSVGAAECLLALRKYQEAIDYLDKIDSTSFSPNERTAYFWATGLVLQQLNRDAEAIPYFHKVSQISGHKYAHVAEIRGQMAARKLGLSWPPATQPVEK